MKKKIIWTFVILISLAIIATVWISLTGNKEIAVTVSEAKEDLIIETLYTNGQIEPINTKQYFAPISGKLEQVLVAKGDSIEAGQLLFQINMDDIVEQIELETINLQILEEERKQAEANYQKQFKELKRENPESNPEALDLSSYDLQIERSKLLLQTYRKKLEQRDIIATSAGKVSELFVQQGEFISPGSSLLTTADLSAYQVKAYMNEVDASKISTGMEVKVLGDSLQQEYIGVIQNISDFATIIGDNADASVEMIIALSGATTNLRAGYNVSIEIALDDEPRLLVPIDAVFYQKDQAYVYQVEDHIVHQVAVTTGKENDTHIEIKSGIDKGAVVVIGEMTSLFDGVKVIMP